MRGPLPTSCIGPKKTIVSWVDFVPFTPCRGHLFTGTFCSPKKTQVKYFVNHYGAECAAGAGRRRCGSRPPATTVFPAAPTRRALHESSLRTRETCTRALRFTYCYAHSSILTSIFFLYII